MASGGGRRKKLRTDRLELLRWRVALQLGFQSVEEWLIATPADWQAKQLAVAWLDRWGDATDEILAQAHNSALIVATASGAKIADESWKTASDVERTPKDASDAANKEPTAQDWSACEAMFRSIIVGR